MKQFILALSATALAITGCHKPVIYTQDDIKKPGLSATGTDTIYLCRYPGFVADPVFNYYMVLNDGVVKDTSRTLPSQPSNYNQVLPATNNSIGADLINSIPAKMYNENGQFYTAGKISDCGGFELIAIINKVRYNWRIEDCYYGLDTNIVNYALKLENACIEFEK